MDVHEVLLDNGIISCSVLDYGCIIRTLNIPDRNGKMVDVVLGYDNLDQYINSSGRMGSVIGRYANRIRNGAFELNGETIRLSINRRPNHIHGGFKGFDKRIWKILEHDESMVQLGYLSRSGEEGYPGNLDVKVTYRIVDTTFFIEYEAVSDRDTVCNLTNHSYFNLSGSNRIDDHHIFIRASRYTPVNDEHIPLGTILEVNGDFDLRNSTSLDNNIAYDINYMLDADDECAVCCSDTSGIILSVSTDMPAMQFYTADGLSERSGKHGVIGKRSGICFETQDPPDTPNNPTFGDCILRKGQAYRHRTSFSFANV